MTEKDFQRSVDELARVLGYSQRYHTYNSMRSAKGFPDLVLVSSERGRIVYLELKADTGKASHEQLEWIAALQLAGAEAFVCWPRDFDAIAKGLQTADWRGLQGPPTKRRKTL